MSPAALRVRFDFVTEIRPSFFTAHVVVQVFGRFFRIVSVRREVRFENFLIGSEYLSHAVPCDGSQFWLLHSRNQRVQRHFGFDPHRLALGIALKKDRLYLRKEGEKFLIRQIQAFLL